MPSFSSSRPSSVIGSVNGGDAGRSDDRPHVVSPPGKTANVGGASTGWKLRHGDRTLEGQLIRVAVQEVRII